MRTITCFLFLMIAVQNADAQSTIFTDGQSASAVVTASYDIAKQCLPWEREVVLGQADNEALMIEDRIDAVTRVRIVGGKGDFRIEFTNRVDKNTNRNFTINAAGGGFVNPFMMEGGIRARKQKGQVHPTSLCLITMK